MACGCGLKLVGGGKRKAKPTRKVKATRKAKPTRKGKKATKKH